jgi:hypothetical protein
MLLYTYILRKLIPFSRKNVKVLVDTYLTILGVTRQYVVHAINIFNK